MRIRRNKGVSGIELVGVEAGERRVEEKGEGAG